jgi:hypothetical protein
MGFGIVMVSATPSSAADGAAQRNENNSSEQSSRMVFLTGVLAAPGARQPEGLFPAHS